jgi:hypothetical protein
MGGWTPRAEGVGGFARHYWRLVGLLAPLLGGWRAERSPPGGAATSRCDLTVYIYLLLRRVLATGPNQPIHGYCWGAAAAFTCHRQDGA